MAKSKKPFKGYNKKKHSRTGGLNDKYRKKINRKEGSNLKRPVTGKVKAGSKAANRRKSFCARMSGVKGPTSKDGQLTPKGAALKRWKCHKSLQKSEMAPKQKLASFLREHIDNKLALKAAEPTITKSNILVGGKGDTKDISDFDAKEVEMGMKVELEHTKDINVAKEIVADHLSEDPAYYSKLKGSGLADELNKAGRCWDGYEPTPGKKPYSKGSCKKIKKSEHKENDSKIQTKELNKNYVNGGCMQKSYHQRLVKALACKCKEKELKKSISAMAIESGEYQGEPLDSHHHNRIGQEYRAMAKQAHTEGNRNKAREYHEKALMHFRKADEMGFQEEEPLEKKISGKLAGIGLATAAALSPVVPPKEIVKPVTPVAVAKPAVQEQPKNSASNNFLNYKTVSPEATNRLIGLAFGKNPEDKFLHNIMQAESSGGTDTNHPIITDKKSIHYGTKAHGIFALMPLTTQEMANRYRRKGGKDPRILQIPQMSKHDVNNWLEKNPDIELELARTLARHVISRFGNTPSAAYAWKYGHNQTDISEEEALKDKYIQKFKELNEGKSIENLIPASQAFGSK